MKKLYVGCRVRVGWVRNPSYAHEVGKEGVIVESRSNSLFTIYGLDTSPIESAGLSWVGFTADQLERIQDPGHRVISWEEMADLWTPEKVGA